MSKKTLKLFNKVNLIVISKNQKKMEGKKETLTMKVI